jgi:hypothetical protein
VVKVLGEQLDFVRISGGEGGSGVFLLFKKYNNVRHLSALLGMKTKYCDI